MRSLFIASGALLLVATASAETRALSGFTGVSASDRIRVEVAIGETYHVDVSGSEADKVRTRVEDGRLIIRRTNRPFWGGPPIDATVRVTMPAVEQLASSRGAELSATGISANALSLSATMGGELSAAGECGSLEVSASMGGLIRAQDLQCRDADVSASMGGEARIFASNHFDVSATMGGAVNVAGGGEGRDIALSMGGSVDRD